MSGEACSTRIQQSNATSSNNGQTTCVLRFLPMFASFALLQPLQRLSRSCPPRSDARLGQVKRRVPALFYNWLWPIVGQPGVQSKCVAEWQFPVVMGRAGEEGKRRLGCVEMGRIHDKDCRKKRVLLTFHLGHSKHIQSARDHS